MESFVADKRSLQILLKANQLKDGKFPLSTLFGRRGINNIVNDHKHQASDAPLLARYGSERFAVMDIK